MRALTMTHPWAMLVALGENTIETRSWSTRYRGALAIHTAKAFPRDTRELCGEEPYRSVLARGGFRSADELPLGVIIALAELDDVMAFTPSSQRETRAKAAEGLLPKHEADFGDFSAGRYGLVLTNVRRLRVPIAARGMLGLWEVAPALARQVRAQAAVP